MTLTIEQNLKASEVEFFRQLRGYAQTVKLDDCRKLAPVIRDLAAAQGLDFIVGCGGSHIYIHRPEQWVEGDHTNPANERLAIITD